MVSCISVTILMSSLKLNSFNFLPQMVSSVKIGPKEEELKSTRHKVINKLFWLFGTSRNAILLVICGAFGYWIQTTAPTHPPPFKLIGNIPSGLPDFQIPKFSLNANESTTGEPESFVRIISSFGSGLIVLPLIGLMENIAICKAFGRWRCFKSPSLPLITLPPLRFKTNE